MCKQQCDDRGEPDCQSGAVHSLVCGTIIYSAVAGDIGVCHADVTRGIATKHRAVGAAAVVVVPVSFQKKESGHRLAQDSAKPIGCRTPSRCAMGGVVGKLLGCGMPPAGSV